MEIFRFLLSPRPQVLPFDFLKQQGNSVGNGSKPALPIQQISWQIFCILKAFG